MATRSMAIRITATEVCRGTFERMKFRREIPKIMVRDEAVEVDADDFCHCDYPASSDWGPELCVNCKRLIDWDLEHDLC